MLVLEVNDIKDIFLKKGHKFFFKKFIETLETDFSMWDKFNKIPRIASHSKDGVIEIMPINNDVLYSFKYVNGHPNNFLYKRCTVMATGQLSEFKTGEPILYTEMTLLTALRTAGTSCLAAKYLANKDSKIIAIIGNGSQSEFHYLAFSTIFDLKELHYFDIDQEAMKKFEKNISKYGIRLVSCKSVEEAVKNADIIVTMTAAKKHQVVLNKEMIKKTPVFICAIGGDCPGKTELSKDLVNESNVFIEFLNQTKIEGEIQQLDHYEKCIELYEIITGKKTIPISKNGINIFDSVGFAIEDYSILRLVYQLAKEYKIGSDMIIVPNLEDVKNLYSILE